MPLCPHCHKVHAAVGAPSGPNPYRSQVQQLHAVAALQNLAMKAASERTNQSARTEGYGQNINGLVPAHMGAFLAPSTMGPPGVSPVGGDTNTSASAPRQWRGATAPLPAGLRAAQGPQPTSQNAAVAAQDYKNGYAVGVAKGNLVNRGYAGSGGKSFLVPAEAYVLGTSLSWQQGWVAGVSSTGARVALNGIFVGASKDAQHQGWSRGVMMQHNGMTGYWISVSDQAVAAFQAAFKAKQAAQAAAQQAASGLGSSKILPWNW